MKLDKGFQKVLLSRLEQLSEEEVTLLRDNIPPEVSELLMYKVLPEIDFLFMAMPNMKDKEFDASRTLDGQALDQFAQEGRVDQGPGPDVGALGELENVGN